MGTENLVYNEIDEVIAQFELAGKLVDKTPYGNGHINDTFRITYEMPDGGQKQYILQKMNHSIFKNPEQLMENVINITEYLRKIIVSQGGNPDRETLNVVKTKDQSSYYQDHEGNYWRIFLFVEQTICLESVESAKDFYDSAVAFGNFQKMLADYPADTLHETIPNFHNTPSRFRDFQKAVAEDKLGRAASARKRLLLPWLGKLTPTY